jgi:putative ABC transport system permease protein
MPNSELKASLRTLYREKSYAFINLLGLSLAIACCLILGLYLRSELTYDRHHVRHSQIFRVVNEFTTNSATDSLAYTSLSLGPLLKKNYSEIQAYVRFRQASEKLLIRSGDKAFYWDNAYIVDDNVFDVFTHKIVYGDPKTALKDPSSAAVSESFARKYFGSENPIGKTINADLVPQVPRKITLVFRDLPENTHLKYSVLFKNVDLQTSPQALFSVSAFTYLVMPEHYNPKDFKLISDSFYTRFMQDLGKTIHISWKSWLQPLADIHLHSNVGYDLPTGNRYYIYGFAAVAAFILIVACINYVNLAIARSAKRAKEIGMRKILGAPRILLMLRFLGDAIFFSMISMIFSLVLVEAALRLTPINNLLGKPLALGLMDEPELLLWMLGLSLLVGLLSGLYPAFYLSSVPPMAALSSVHGGKRGSFRLRELLVLTQFTVSVIVIACTLVMAMQMRFLTHKPLGFKKENLITINLRGLDLIEKYPVIQNEISKNSHILGVTACTAMIGTGQGIPLNAAAVDNNEGVQETFGINHIGVADNFLEITGMQLASGRDFSKRLLTDVGSSFIVNETMVKKRGWKDPLAKRIGLGQDSGRVIGVVKDFHYRSLHHPVEPFAMHHADLDFNNIPAELRAAIQIVMVLKIDEKDRQNTLNFLQRKFTEYDPQHPFEYSFVDDAIEKLYLSEERLMRMTGIFSGICIFISCLGLFGLASFTTEQRSKEIGIRKVLGASASQIIIMLAQKTLLLVLASAILASIAAYFAIYEWLTSFAYRVGINPAVFFIATAVVMAVAFFTVALQSYKTAQTNPARTLRYE